MNGSWEWDGNVLRFLVVVEWENLGVMIVWWIDWWVRIWVGWERWFD